MEWIFDMYVNIFGLFSFVLIDNLYYLCPGKTARFDF
jgi:hypothetical protein